MRRNGRNKKWFWIGIFLIALGILSIFFNFLKGFYGEGFGYAVFAYLISFFSIIIGNAILNASSSVDEEKSQIRGKIGLNLGIFSLILFLLPFILYFFEQFFFLFYIIFYPIIIISSLLGILFSYLQMRIYPTKISKYGMGINILMLISVIGFLLKYGIMNVE